MTKTSLRRSSRQSQRTDDHKRTRVQEPVHAFQVKVPVPAVPVPAFTFQVKVPVPAVPVPAFQVPAPVAVPERKQEAIYTHNDGTKELVRLIKEHSHTEGGAFTIFIPSISRERQTIASRLAAVPVQTSYNIKCQLPAQVPDNTKFHVPNIGGLPTTSYMEDITELYGTKVTPQSHEAIVAYESLLASLEMCRSAFRPNVPATKKFFEQTWNIFHPVNNTESPFTQNQVKESIKQHHSLRGLAVYNSIQKPADKSDKSDKSDSYNQLAIHRPILRRTRST
jgi:hypothetical protein